MFYRLSPELVEEFPSLTGLEDYYYLFGRRLTSTLERSNWETIALVKPQEQSLLVITTTYPNGKAQCSGVNMPIEQLRDIKLLEDSTPEWFDYIELRFHKFHSWYLYQSIEEKLPLKGAKSRKNKV